MYLRERLAGEEAAGRASVEPGPVLPVPRRRPTSSSSASTRRRSTSSGAGRLFEYPKHWEFIAARVSAAAGRAASRWRIPFGHHPPFCAGPQHHNTRGMERADRRCSSAAACARRFSGHEHNFQHSHRDGIDYFVSGAGAKIRRRTPDGFAEAHTLTWSGECHFLLVTIDGDDMTVRAIGESPEARASSRSRATRRPANRLRAGPMSVRARASTG